MDGEPELDPAAEIYTIRPFARRLSFAVLVLFAIIGTILLSVYLSGSQITRDDISIVIFTTAPWILFTFYNLIHNSGTVTLTTKAISLERLGRTRRLLWQDVLTIRERDHHFPPNLVLKSARTTLRINRRIENLPRLYTYMRQHIPTQLTPVFPWTLRIRRRVILQSGLTFLLSLGLLAGFVTWILSLRSQTPGTPPAIIILVAVLLLVALIWIGWQQEIMPAQPSRLTCTANQIQFRYPLGGKQTWAATDLEDIKLVAREMPVRVQVGGVQIRERHTEYWLRLYFRGGHHLHISERRAWQLGISPQQLKAGLQHLYLTAAQNTPIT